jgi:3-oxoadipate enol-lactonase
MGKNVDLFFLDQGMGIPVIFLHGYPLDHRVWMPIIPLLKKGIRIIAPDLRGMGRSPSTEGVYSMELMAGDLIHLLDQLEIKKVVMAGHSMGGYVTFKFGQLFPERILGIALVATRSNPDPEEKKIERLQSARDVLNNGTSGIIKGMLPRLTKNSDLYPRIMEIMEGASKQGVVGILQGIAERENASTWLPTIQVPVVVIAGKEDQIVPLDEVFEMARKLPTVKLEVIENVGHMPMMENPSRVAECINNLVDLVS